MAFWEVHPSLSHCNYAEKMFVLSAIGKPASSGLWRTKSFNETRTGRPSFAVYDIRKRIAVFPFRNRLTRHTTFRHFFWVMRLLLRRYLRLAAMLFLVLLILFIPPSPILHRMFPEQNQLIQKSFVNVSCVMQFPAENRSLYLATIN